MPCFLSFPNPKYAIQALKIIGDRKQVTFEIDPTGMRISTLSSPYFYLTIHKDLFEISSPINFTIDISILLPNLALLPSSLIVLHDSFTIVVPNSEIAEDQFKAEIESLSGKHVLKRLSELGSTFISVPFTTPINGNYVSEDSFSTRLLINKNILKCMLTGVVTYLNEGMLIIRKSDCNGSEIMEIESDYLEEGFLNFTCSNEWVQRLRPHIEVISTILFCFSETMLHVKVMLGKLGNSFLEIQVSEHL